MYTPNTGGQPVADNVYVFLCWVGDNDPLPAYVPEPLGQADVVPRFTRSVAQQLVERTNLWYAQDPASGYGAHATWENDDVVLDHPNGTVERIAQDDHGRYPFAAWYWTCTPACHVRAEMPSRDDGLLALRVLAAWGTAAQRAGVVVTDIALNETHTDATTGRLIARVLIDELWYRLAMIDEQIRAVPAPAS